MARLPQMLRLLPADAQRGIFVLSTFLYLVKVTAGPLHHAILQEWIESGRVAEEDLKRYVFDRFGRKSQTVRAWERAFKVCEDREAGGRWVGVWTGAGPPRRDGTACPRVIFGRGCLDDANPWVAVFNSRKPRIVTGAEEWLVGLRKILPAMESMGYGFASSRGTATYDLVAGYAARTGCRTLLVESVFPDESGAMTPSGQDSVHGFPTVHLSCTSPGGRCSKAVGHICRDRLLAFVADLHCVLEIRRGGNLHRVLESQQTTDAKPLVVFRPTTRGPENEGTERLRDDFPERVWAFSTEDFPECVAGFRKDRLPAAAVKGVNRVAWSEYLYHYTRGCPGPWPGQPHREYIEDLLDGGALCAHRALDTLVRIITEGRLRASRRLVRGEVDVVSWTSRPPLDLRAFRLWNPGLIRWTFEPYGLAVRKRVLRKQGAQPVIYAPSPVHQRLRPDDKYRFQKHEPPRCSWKHEREWRIREDVLLKDLAPSDWFIFVPDDGARNELAHRCEGILPVSVLSEAADGTPRE